MNLSRELMSLLVLMIFSSTLNAQKPNIICILTDDLGYGDLSCQGATDLQSPNIDRLADDGLKFNNFYANCPVCSPSRASLLTGRYPDLVGVPGVIRQWEDDSWGYLQEDAVTIAQVLKSAGYHTAMVGKWHLGFEAPNIPNDKGFDHFKGFLGDMMDDYWIHERGGVNWMRDNKHEIRPEGHATDLFTDWAIEYVDELKDNTEPFFLYLAYNAPHFPIQPPKEYLERVLQREAGIDEKRALNVAFIEHLDYSIGRFLTHLEQSDLAENTLIIFTSDNGGALWYSQSNGPLRGGKQQMYEGGIRVPALAMWKGRIKAGSQTDKIGMLMDLFPTFSELGGADSIMKVDGISLLPTLLGKPQASDDRYLFWVRREGGHFGGQAYYAARYKDYKILQNSAYEPMQFYEIGKDQYETTNLETENNEHFKDLRKALREHVRASGQVPWQKSKD